MRRVAAAFAFFASVILAAYGHCWPMLAVQMRQHAESSHAAHDHEGHEPQHHHPTEGFGQELSVPGVPQGPVVVLQAPAAKSFAPILLLVAVAEHEAPDPTARSHHRARAGPAFAEFHARTGRLLI
jgi:hypothetical protein